MMAATPAPRFMSGVLRAMTCEPVDGHVVVGRILVGVVGGDGSISSIGAGSTHLVDVDESDTLCRCQAAACRQPHACHSTMLIKQSGAERVVGLCCCVHAGDVHRRWAAVAELH